MIIYYKDIPQVLLDNERAYFKILQASIEAVDELSTMEIRRNPSSYQFRIAISSRNYLNPLVSSLNDLHNLLGISLTYSKSIKSSYALSFKIPLTSQKLLQNN